MKDLLQDIGKKMPFEETEAYLDGLIHRATEDAIKQQGREHGTRRLVTRATSAAAVALVTIGIGLTVFNHMAKQEPINMHSDGPIDEFLSTLTDEEVAQLPYYDIEEIPEY